MSFLSDRRKIKKEKTNTIRVGKKFQAVIPEIEPYNNDESTDIGDFNSKKSFKKKTLIKNDFIQLHNPDKISDIEYANFIENLKKLFLNKKNEKKMKFGDEKLLYLLNIFNYDCQRCLNYVGSHPKNWKYFLLNFKI